MNNFVETDQLLKFYSEVFHVLFELMMYDASIFFFFLGGDLTWKWNQRWIFLHQVLRFGINYKAE